MTAQRERAEVWQCVASDGTTHWFESQTDADFFSKDAVERGLAVRTQPVPIPRTKREFIAFMEGYPSPEGVACPNNIDDPHCRHCGAPRHTVWWWDCRRAALAKADTETEKHND